MRRMPEQATVAQGKEAARISNWYLTAKQPKTEINKSVTAILTAKMRVL